MAGGFLSLSAGADCAPLQIAWRGFAGGGFAVFVGADAFDLAEAFGKIGQGAEADLLSNLGQAEK